jgi:hypothetical protein
MKFKDTHGGHKIFITFLILVLSAFSLAACSGSYLNDEKKLAYIKITPDKPDITAGAKINFSASGIDNGGGKLIISPIWEAHDGRIDSAGVYIAPSYATVDRITAFVDSKSATAVVKVKTHPEAKTIKIYPELKFLSCGAKQKFRASGFNAFGEEVAVSVRWESRNGTISAEGEYSAPLTPVHDAIGAKTLSATGALPIEIKPREVYKVFITPNKTSVKGSGVIKFSAAAYDIYSNKIEDELGFRFSALKGKITDEGYYFAPNITGTDEVGVTFNFIRDSAEIELIP